MKAEKALLKLKETTRIEYQGMFNSYFENLFKDLWELGYSLSCAYLHGDSVFISIIPQKANLPDIIAKNWNNKDVISFKIQTYSAGSLTLAELDNYLAGYETAKEAIKILNSFVFSDLWQKK